MNVNVYFMTRLETKLDVVVRVESVTEHHPMSLENSHRILILKSKIKIVSKPWKPVESSCIDPETTSAD